MTREEAKEILTHNWTRVDNPNYSESELDEAFFMAIEALTEPNMIPIKLEKRYPKSRVEDITDAFMQGYLKGEANRPKGEWIKVPDRETVYACNKCGCEPYYFGDINTIKFCPNCGADMRGDEK